MRRRRGEKPVRSRSMGTIATSVLAHTSWDTATIPFSKLVEKRWRKEQFVDTLIPNWK
jgi:hypothetical protein